MHYVRPKKKLGQHFLKDQNIAQKIVESLGNEVPNVLEIGPGTGVLTQYMNQRPELNIYLIEIDNESVTYLHDHYPALRENLFHGDFLKMDIATLLPHKFTVIGNFPYNISSQIFFRVLEFRDRIPEVVGMVQKEVAERISSSHGNKSYGILSVLLQAFYSIEYLFTVSEHVFDPPPKVKSAVIRLKRNQVEKLECDEKLFISVVKAAFHHRRKMFRNSLKDLCENLPEEFEQKRPEQLTVSDFIRLTVWIEKNKMK